MIRFLIAPLRPHTTPLFPPVLCDDAVEVLRPFRPALDTPRMLVTVLVAQHRGLAGRVGAGGVPGALTPRQQVVVISEGSMDGFASTVTKYSFES